MRRLLPFLAAILVGCGGDTVGTTVGDTPVCIGDGTHDSIQAALQGPGAVATLCQGAVFDLGATVAFTDTGQAIRTEGRPTGSTRAVLRLADTAVTTAVTMLNVSSATLSHVIVDGRRPALGHRQTGALIQAGGAASDQVIESVRALEPRGWTVIHLFEGPADQRCTGATVRGNHLGPAGRPDGTWADGISLACTNSVVTGNLIVDPTDGGIVVFGAPGSEIRNNTIRAETRRLLGGINMVDYLPYDGDYTNTVVADNRIVADGARLHIGLAMGWRTWVCFDAASSSFSDPTLRGAVVRGNSLEGPDMRFGYAVDGVTDWTVTGNTSTATHTGTPVRPCNGDTADAPAAFQRHEARSSGTFQAEFQDARLEMALWSLEAPP